MWFARADDGFILGGLGRTEVASLRGVPMLLESNDERVRRRLLPETYEDEEAEAQWRRHATPELERLFMSRTQIVRRDLAKLRQLKAADSWVMPIPDTHVNAWLASLNAARLALFALNDLTAEQMEREGVANCTPKQREALLRIHFLAELQCVLMGDLDIADDPDEDDDDHTAGEAGWTIAQISEFAVEDLGVPCDDRDESGDEDKDGPESDDEDDGEAGEADASRRDA